MKLFVSLITALFLDLYTITSHSVDGIEISMPISCFISEVGSRRDILQDTITLEGNDYTIFKVYQNGTTLYSVEPECHDTVCTVWRIRVHDNRFKTRKGISTGSTLGDLLDTYTFRMLSTESDIGIAVFVNEIEVTFFLDSSGIPQDWWFNPDIENLCPERKIKMIMIT
ncbi:hypothetical protein CHISP_0533 [Chitinispirillum alkaliphilum]|nr:hypothetical protein CHISP_0533 [Chitinispirillum alkaliphilum]